MGLLVNGTVNGRFYEKKSFTANELIEIFNDKSFNLKEILDSLPEQVKFEAAKRFRSKNSVANKVDMIAEANVQGGPNNDVFSLKYYERKSFRVTKLGASVEEYTPRHISLIEGKLVLNKKKDLEKIIYLLLSNQFVETPFNNNSAPTYSLNNPYATAKKQMEIARLKSELDTIIQTGSIRMLRRKSAAFGLGTFSNTTIDDFVRSKYHEKLLSLTKEHAGNLTLLLKALKAFQEKFESSTSYLIGLIQDCLDNAIFEQSSDNRNVKTIKWGRAANERDRGQDICKVMPGQSIHNVLVEYVESHLDTIVPKIKGLLFSSKKNFRVKEALSFADELYNDDVKAPVIAIDATKVKSIDVKTLIHTCIENDYIYYDRKEKSVYKVKAGELDKTPICKLEGEGSWTVQFAKYLTENDKVNNSLRAGIRTKLSTNK
jgi:hypothetical protein